MGGKQIPTRINRTSDHSSLLEHETLRVQLGSDVMTDKSMHVRVLHPCDVCRLEFLLSTEVQVGHILKEAEPNLSVRTMNRILSAF